MTLQMRYQEKYEQGLERGLEQGLEQGLEKGLEKGISGAVQILKKNKYDDEQIVEQIMAQFNLEKEEAERYTNLR